jgi:hypothetical protein
MSRGAPGTMTGTAQLEQKRGPTTNTDIPVRYVDAVGDVSLAVGGQHFHAQLMFAVSEEEAAVIRASLSTPHR